MKFLLVLFLSVAFLNSYGQDTVSLKSAPDSAKVTLGRVYNDAKDALTGLGKALKVGSEHVYQVLVKQQLVQSIIWIVIFVIVLLGSIGLVKYLKWLDKKPGNSDDNLGYIVLAIVLCILDIILVIAFMCHIQDIITGFVNPEYGAIKDILEFVKPK